MNISNNLRLQIAWIALLAACILPLGAHTKKGDKLLKDGQKAEEQKDYDTALTDYEEALDEDPSEPAYLIAMNRVRGEDADLHIQHGRTLQREQKLEAALVEFQRAYLAEPSSEIALQEIHQTTQMIKEQQKAPPGTIILTPAERARKEVEDRINSLEGPPTLRPINNQITSLKMNNQPARVLYESVCKLAGINVLFDPSGIDSTFGTMGGGGGGKNVNLDLNNVTLEEALNYVALVTHTFWKPISHNAIFVTQESEPKRQEYQDEVVKVFYIQNASTANEFNEIYNGVRTGAKLTTGIFQVASQNAIIARGTPDTIALVEKLVHDLDRPKPEIVVDVMVMEVAKSKMSTLGAAIAGQTGGLNVPIVFTPQNGTVITTGSTTSTTGTTTSTTGTTGTTTSTTGTTTSTTGTTTGTTGTTTSTTGTTGTTTGTTGTTTGSSSFITLSQLGHLSTNDWSITLPGALIQALLTDASTRLLQRPEVRVTDGGKASLKIGSRIPYVSGSLNSAVATPGAIPYATTQFQQVDVGVQIDLTPHVNGAQDVSMHIKVEVSNVTQTVTIAGVQQPVIGQKVDETDIRMRDGEVSLLGGLTSDSDSRTTAGIPGVANLPALGYLFGTRTRDREKDDIVIALIPHIVRAPDLTNIADQGVYVGTDRVVRVERRADGTQASQPLPVPVNSQPISPSAPVPQPAPAAPPAASYPQVQTAPGQQAPQNQAPAPPQNVPARPPLLAPQNRQNLPRQQNNPPAGPPP